jgi:hypothetical protein
MERNEPRETTAVHGLLGITYHQKEIANATANCLENQITSHDLCDENHERDVGTRVQALLASVDGTPLRKIRLMIYIH